MTPNWSRPSSGRVVVLVAVNEVVVDGVDDDPELHAVRQANATIALALAMRGR
jgi:hypothetical protein